jgi:cytochrome b561
MQIRNSHRAWGFVQQAFHWITAVAVISQLTVGLIFANLPENDPRGGTLFGVHATLGLVILIIMLARFASP